MCRVEPLLCGYHAIGTAAQYAGSINTMSGLSSAAKRIESTLFIELTNQPYEKSDGFNRMKSTLW